MESRRFFVGCNVIELPEEVIVSKEIHLQALLDLHHANFINEQSQNECVFKSCTACHNLNGEQQKAVKRSVDVINIECGEWLRVRALTCHEGVFGTANFRSFKIRVILNDENRYTFAGEELKVVGVVYSGDHKTGHFWCSFEIGTDRPLTYFYNDMDRQGFAIPIDGFDNSERAMGAMDYIDLVKVTQ